MTPILFIDRDGTLIEEPEDFQIDAYEKVRFVAGVIPALLKLRDAGYQFVIVSNQDGLGSEQYPRASFDGPQALMMQVFESQGGRISVCDGWRTGPQKDKGARLTVQEAGAMVDELMKQAVPAQKVWGT